MMKRVSVAELKARLSEFLAAAKAGEDVVVTERGRPVARLTGLQGSLSSEARVEALLRAGLVRPPRGRLRPKFLELPRPADPQGRSLELVREEREGGW
ncbi:MAG: type II toxin-antitoxin system Phd/YefM family antitoxin [Longimicrobiales bacterium]